MLAGLFLAFSYDLSSGAAIIIVASVLMFGALIYAKVFKTQS
jgi:ABC-type Mn2+/Zn2+ transport system permease subunit